MSHENRRDPLASLVRALTILTAVSLAVTGEVNPVAALAVPVAVVMGASWEKKGRRPGGGFEITFQVIGFVGLIYFLGQAVGLLQLLAGSVALIFIGQAYYSMKPMTRSGIGRLQLLAFFQILALSTTTTNILFLAPFLLYLVLAPLSYTLMALESTEDEEREIPAPLGWPGVRSSLAASLVALAATALLFPLVPRYEAGISLLAQRQQERQGPHMSGFSESVQFGDISEIKDSNEVVLRARLEGPAPEELRWRGIALDAFDGRGWSVGLPQSRRIVATRHLDGWPAFLLPNAQESEPVFEASVQLEPLNTNVLFHPTGTQVIASRQIRGLDLDLWQNVYADRERRHRFEYALQVQYLKEDRLALPERVHRRMVHLPDRLNPRIEEQAREIVGDLTDPEPQARRMEAWLSTRLGYSLQIDDVGVEDPLSYFLFEKREGHCEYFASAMATMMRTLDVPARVVNGFQQGRYSNFTGTWTVRGRDAHSWVEVWLPGRGWTAFDPTPAVPEAIGQGLLSDMQELGTLVVQYWDDHVIGFNIYAQLNALLNLKDRFLDMGRQLGPAAPLLVPGAISLPVLAILLLIARRRGWGKRRPGPSTAWMQKASRILERKGWGRSGDQTWAEWAEAVTTEAGPSAKNLHNLVRIYYDVRFGGGSADPRQIQELMAELRTVPTRREAA